MPPRFHGRRFFAFFAANIVQKLGQLGLLFLLVSFGSAEDVAIFGLFTSYFLIAIPLATQNLHLAIGRLYFNFDDRDGQARNNLALTLLVSGVLAGTMGSALAQVMLWRWPQLSTELVGLGLLLTAGAAICTCSQFFNVLLRVRDSAGTFVVFNFVLGAGLPLLFGLFGLVYGFNGRAAVHAYVWSNAMAALAGFWFCREGLRVRRPWFAWGGIRQAVAYGAGTMAHGVSQWVVNYSGRWIGIGSLSSGEMASYTLLSQFYAMITLFITSVFEAQRLAVLEAFARGANDEGVAQLRRPTELGLMGVAAVYAPFIAFGPQIARFLGPEYEFPRLLFLIAMAISATTVVMARTYWIAMGLVRTRLFGGMAAVSAVLTIGLAYALVDVLGVTGLLLASFVGSLALTVYATVAFAWIVKRGRGQGTPDVAFKAR